MKLELHAADRPSFTLYPDGPGSDALEIPLGSDAPRSASLEIEFPIGTAVADLPAIYRGMRGEPGPEGPPADDIEMPDLALYFENRLT